MRTFELPLLYWYQSLFSLSEGLHIEKKSDGGGVSVHWNTGLLCKGILVGWKNEWADRNLLKFNRGRYQALHLGGNSAMHQCRA